MLDTGSSTNLLSKRVAKKIGAKRLSRKAIESYQHLKSLSKKLHISGGNVDLLIGINLVDEFVDARTACGVPEDLVAKRNCFGWYLLGPVESVETPLVQSVTVNRVSAVVEDVLKLVQQDSLDIKPTKLCICSDIVLKENKFVKALNESTTLVDGRVEIRMPWEEQGPPKQSNYDITLKRMYIAEKKFKKKVCFEVVDEEVQKLVNQEFVIKVPPEEIIFPFKQCLRRTRAPKLDLSSICLRNDTTVSP